MTLDTYLQKRHISDSGFARQLKVDRSYIGKLRRFESTPSFDLTIKILLETNGEVGFFDYLSPEKKANLVNTIDEKGLSVNIL